MFSEFLLYHFHFFDRIDNHCFSLFLAILSRSSFILSICSHYLNFLHISIYHIDIGFLQIDNGFYHIHTASSPKLEAGSYLNGFVIISDSKAS